MNEQIEQARLLLTERKFAEAEELLRRSVGQDPTDAEVFNLLGVSRELRGQLQEASRFYRAALSFEPACTPAQQNLKRVTRWPYFAKGLSEELKPGHPTDR